MESVFSYTNLLPVAVRDKAYEMLRLLRDHINRYRYLTIAIPGRHRAASREHEVLLEVLRARNPEASERAMREHVLEAGNWMMRRLRETHLNGKT
ncbi:MAG: FCD domain-containing protein [Armatimonadota bacterium]|nr:FCD domain-containing protein [Armatimonadota bacterium]MDR5702059.1 FCD domain-containing protein [Armatimonadota bacterium]MDR7434584.1 FCD domain-containing protein [Armatimonadota bacterium]